ncbi:hypothetical protein X566_17885 [Afipia sp. P52-10]|nr:hypothetical protein X566_17885 [Afipia sp. P52-10]
MSNLFRCWMFHWANAAGQNRDDAGFRASD